MPCADWRELDRELDRWAEHDRRATLWCRDDDAYDCSSALEKLVSMSDAAGVPVALAVIPVLATESLAVWVRQRKIVTVLVHGYAHLSHAPTGEKRAEFGAHRPLEVMVSELRLACTRIVELFRAHSLPLFVPPWNRLSFGLLDKLSNTGLAAIATYQARACAQPALGIKQSNCHVDIIDWKSTCGCVGEQRAPRLLIDHLAARRLGTVDADEATGILTHHKDHDDGCWLFLGQLWRNTGKHPGASWVNAEEAMWPH